MCELFESYMDFVTFKFKKFLVFCFIGIIFLIY